MGWYAYLETETKEGRKIIGQKKNEAPQNWMMLCSPMDYREDCPGNAINAINPRFEITREDAIKKGEFFTKKEDMDLDFYNELTDSLLNQEDKLIITVSEVIDNPDIINCITKMEILDVAKSYNDVYYSQFVDIDKIQSIVEKIDFLEIGENLRITSKDEFEDAVYTCAELNKQGMLEEADLVAEGLRELEREGVMTQEEFDELMEV